MVIFNRRGKVSAKTEKFVFWIVFVRLIYRSHQRWPAYINTCMLAHRVCIHACVCFIFFFFLFSFWGCTLILWKFPGSGSHQSCSCWPAPQPQQHQIQAESAACSTAHGNARSLTRWVRPGIEPTSTSGQVHYHWATMGTPHVHVLYPSFDKGFKRVLLGRGD